MSISGKKNVFLEFCDYVRFPLGGQLTFAKNFIENYSDTFEFVGWGTSGAQVGKWSLRMHQNTAFNFFGVGCVEASDKKPLVPARVAGVLRFFRHLRELRGREYEMAFVQSPESLVCALLLRVERITYRFAGINNPVKYSRYKLLRALHPLFEIIFKKLLMRVSYVLVTSTKTDVDVVSKMLAASSRLVEVTWHPTLINDSIFHPPIEPRKLDFPDIVFVGRLNEGKGWTILLDSFRELRKNYANSRLTIVGDGEDDLKIRKRVDELDLGGSVRLLGGLQPTKVADVMRSANIFCFPSAREGWPTVLVEAVACGLYVVSSDVSGAREIISSSNDGVIVNRRDPDAFARALIHAWDAVQGRGGSVCDLEIYSSSRFRSNLDGLWKKGA